VSLSPRVWRFLGPGGWGTPPPVDPAASGRSPSRRSRPAAGGLRPAVVPPASRRKPALRAPCCSRGNAARLRALPLRGSPRAVVSAAQGVHRRSVVPPPQGDSARCGPSSYRGNPLAVLPDRRKGNAAGLSSLPLQGELHPLWPLPLQGGHRSLWSLRLRQAELAVVLRPGARARVLRGSPWRNFGGAAVGPAAAALARCWDGGHGWGRDGCRWCAGDGPGSGELVGRRKGLAGGRGRRKGSPWRPPRPGTLDQGLEDGLSHGGAMAPSGPWRAGLPQDQSRELPRPFFARKTAPGSSAARECSTGAPAGSAGAQGGGRVPAAASVAARRRTARRARSAAARRADVLFFSG